MADEEKTEATEEDIALMSLNIAVAMISLAMGYWVCLSKDGYSLAEAYRAYQLFIQPYIVAVFALLWLMFILYRVFSGAAPTESDEEEEKDTSQNNISTNKPNEHVEMVKKEYTNASTRDAVQKANESKSKGNSVDDNSEFTFYVAALVVALALIARVYYLKFYTGNPFVPARNFSDAHPWKLVHDTHPLRSRTFRKVIEDIRGEREWKDLTNAEHNTAGVAEFMVGNPKTSISHFREVLVSSKFGPQHVAAAKNVRWVHMAMNSNLFDKATDRLEKMLKLAISSKEKQSGDTFYDLALQHAICTDPMYTRNRVKQQWKGISSQRRWRMQYFDVLKKSLTNYLYRDINDWRQMFIEDTNDQNICATGGCESEWDPNQGAHGFDGSTLPVHGHSVLRLGNMNHIQFVIEDVIAKGIKGDIIEAGCFRGGTGVLMRAAADEDESRTVWIADSFMGIPMPRTAKGMNIDETKDWKSRYEVTQESVEAVFRRYGFHDHRTKFLAGFFNESLTTPVLKNTQFSVIHIDVDSYDSVLDALAALYPKLTRGGYVIIDDIHLFGVREAIREFMSEKKIMSPLLPVPCDFTTTCPTDLRAKTPQGETPKHINLVTPLSTGYWVKP